MEANNNRRTSRRKPLSDCTNTAAATSSSSASNTIKRSSTTLRKPIIPSLKQQPNNKTLPAPTRSAAASVSLPPPAASPPPRLPPNPSSSLTGVASSSVEETEPRSVYSRRKRKDKGKQVLDPVCYSAPPVNTRSARDTMKEAGVTCQPKSCTVPSKKKQRWTASEENVCKISLPQDFIEKQRAYFAEVDAFELPVEEVDAVDQMD